MSDYDRALSQVREIHAHLARGEVIRCWHWLTATFTAALAVAAAFLQEHGGVDSVAAYARYWVLVAGLAGAGALLDIALHIRRYRRPATLRLARTALWQFLPALGAGAALAVVLGPKSGGVYLPGLWSIIFALGLSAARTQLPRGISGVVAFHLFAGLALLWRAEPDVLPSPWDMGGVFALGQALLALVMHADIVRHPRGGLDD